jgi:hypothetical protein
MEQCFFDVSGGKGCVNFEQFIGFMVCPDLWGAAYGIGGLGGG